MATSVKVLIEEGRRRTFASAVDWPGWSRSGRDRAAALETLEAYRTRYSDVLAGAGVAPPVGRLVVAQTVPGDAGTEFGVPSQQADADLRRLTSAERVRLCAILTAAWDAFDEATSAPARLRTGPRGGGRTLAQLRRHVTDAEVAYARGLGLRVAASDGDPERIAAVRDDVRGVVLGRTIAPRPARWPVRYAVRRTAWHVLDHLFEREDRAED